MTQLLFANNAETTIAGPISSTATSVSVAAGTGVLFPNPGAGQAFKLTFVSAADVNVKEIVLVTAVSGDTFTIVRGQEATAAAAWNAGDFANHWLTAGSFANFLQGNFGAQAFIYYGMDSTNTNTYAATVTPTITALSNGMTFDLDITNASTSTTCTFNPSGIGAIPIHRADGSALLVGDIAAAPFHARFVYDLGSNTMLLQNPAANFIPIATAVRAIPALIATANSSAGQSIAANTNVTMNSGFSTSVNTFANSTMSGGAFTVGTGEAGTYLIYGSCHLPTAVDNVFLNLSKNGVAVPAFSQQIAATNIIQNCNVVGFAQLIVGDVITLQVQQQNTSNAAETVNNNSLQVIRIGA